MKKNTKLQLRFVGENDVQLQAIEFSHRLLHSPIVGTRGKANLSQNGLVFFQWTSGVRALCVFFVRSVLQAVSGNLTEAVMQGGGNSAAATLDYALARQSNWLLDLFGADSTGASLSRRFISRVNPERKRPGPVRIFLQTNVLSPSEITIEWNGKSVLTEEHLRQLASVLEEPWREDRVLNQQELPSISAVSICRSNGQGKLSTEQLEQRTEEEYFPRPFDMPASREVLRQMFADELLLVLRRGGSFGDKAVQASLTRMFHDPTFVHFAGRDDKFVAPMAERRSAKNRFGFASPETAKALEGKSGEPLRVNLPGGYVAGIALFKYLIEVQRLPIELDYHFVHAGEVLEHHQQDGDHLKNGVAVVGDGHLSEFFSSGASVDYAGVMLMPELSFQIVAASGERSTPIDSGCYHLLGGGKSSSFLYLQRLLKSGVIRKNKIQSVEATPEEIATNFLGQDPDLKAIQWFPYYRLHERFCGNSLLVPENDDTRFRPNVMICHREFLQGSRRSALEQVVRDAWLTLIESPLALHRVVDMLVSDAAYLKFISRSAGFHHLPPPYLVPRMRSNVASPQAQLVA